MPKRVRKRSGFTLIELLVVIAIIGILATVVLASLNSARTKSRDAAIRSELAQMRSQAALFFATHGSLTPSGPGGGDDSINECTGPTHSSYTKFVGTLFDMNYDDGLNARIRSAHSKLEGMDGVRIYCRVNSRSWAVAMPLHNPPDGMTGWCVDSDGASKAVDYDFISSLGGKLGDTTHARCT